LWFNSPLSFERWLEGAGDAEALADFEERLAAHASGAMTGEGQVNTFEAELALLRAWAETMRREVI
jgi:hypothetical protein